MAIDKQLITRFAASSATRQKVHSIVTTAGFEVSYVKEYGRQLWGFYLRPNSLIKELFGTPQEVLLWVAEFERFQSLSIEQAQDIIAQDPLRLCQDFALVFVADRAAHLLVDQVAESLSTVFVGLSLATLDQFAPIGNDDFILALQSRLYAKDLYRHSTALTSPRTFYGRKDLLTELAAILKQESSNVGVFGLRKCGKTSLLYRLLQTLKEVGNVFPAHIDVQIVDSINPSTPYLLWSIGEALLDSNSQLRRLKGYRLFGKYALFNDAPKEPLVDLFDHDIRHTIRNTRRRLVLLFDEFELMAPSTPGSQWGDSFVQVWRLLRGLHQQLAGHFAYFVTGTNPRCVERNKVGQIENPVYNYFDVRYLPPLRGPECHQLLRDLGERMGLHWDPAASSRLTSLVGGHPFLLRAYASTVHRALLPRRSRVGVTVTDVDSQLEPFLREFSSHLAQMVDVLADEYPDEYCILEQLAFGNLGQFREMVKAFPEETAHLIGYGLVSSALTDSALKIEVLQTWFQRRRLAQKRANVGLNLEEGFPASDAIAGYEIEASVGEAGGFATVYRARRQASPGVPEETVAIKVLHKGSLAHLQREMDVLQAVRHQNIVRFIDHGKSAEGRLFLVMEYLEGHTLHQRCQRATRLMPEEVLAMLKALTEALVHLHPDESRMQTLRKKKKLNLHEYEEMGKARHGYVHRDITPRNVIVVAQRGPVLIDFNIATQVFARAGTHSGTLGYLPPDGVPQVWTPDVDRYQLGLTILQASVGVAIEHDGRAGSNIGDLKAMAEAELPATLLAILTRLTYPKLSDRFGSTSQLQEALQRVNLA